VQPAPAPSGGRQRLHRNPPTRAQDVHYGALSRRLKQRVLLDLLSRAG
jgi:hypothetical protein